MVNVYTLLNRIKTALDADTTLNNSSYLNRATTGAAFSKVFVGNNLPGGYSPPIIQILLVSDDENIYTKLTTFTIGFNIYVLDLPSGQEDLSRLCAIASRLNTLLDDQRFTDMTNITHFNTYLTNVFPVMKDREASEKQSFQHLRFDAHAIATA